MYDFSGKTALVTGGSRGIGAAIVARLLQNGATVITCGRGTRPHDLDQAVTWHQMDISSADDITALKDNIVAEFGRLDLLVNNAGVQVEKTVTESLDQDWDDVMGHQCQGCFHGVPCLYPCHGATWRWFYCQYRLDLWSSG